MLVTAYNQELSAKRLTAVKNYLTEKILQHNPNADIDKILQTGSGAGETDAFGAKEANGKVTIDMRIPAKEFENHSVENEY